MSAIPRLAVGLVLAVLAGGACSDPPPDDDGGGDGGSDARSDGADDATADSGDASEDGSDDGGGGDVRPASCPQPSLTDCGDPCEGDAEGCLCRCGGPNFSACSCVGGSWDCPHCGGDP